jgi:DNA-binding Lrp family transcriptional regulator
MHNLQLYKIVNLNVPLGLNLADILLILLVLNILITKTMTTAFVLLNVERTQINAIGEKLAGMQGITEVFSVSGNYDLIALIRVSTNDDLADLITDKLTKIEGITKTETMIAFRTLSRYDIASIFDLGN